jgi:hypothetical protein
VGAQRPRTPFFAQFSPPRDGEGPGVGSFQPDFEKAIGGGRGWVSTAQSRAKDITVPHG